MPPPDRIIVSAFNWLGYALDGGMGKVPLTWSEVGAYSLHSGANLTPWEAEQVVMMSRQYCYMLHYATQQRSAPIIYSPRITDEQMKERGAWQFENS